MQNRALSQNGDQLTAYRSVFVAYILGALRESLARVRAADNLVPDAQRVQAWHVLSYALRVDDAWPDARDLLLALAPKMEQAGFRVEWIAYLERGVVRSRALGDRRGEAELSLHVGHLHRLVSAFPQAEAWLSRSLRHFEHGRDDRGAAQALNQLAYVAYLQHHYADATARVERAMALLPADDAERAMSCFVLGMVAIDHKRWDEAEEHHGESLRLHELHGNRRGMAWALQNVGYASQAQGKFKQAVSYYQQAISRLDSLHDAMNKAIIQMNLGIAYYHIGDFQPALIEYQKAVAVFQKLRSQLFIAKSFVNLGLCHMAMQDWISAEKYFFKSAEAFRELGDKGEELNALDGLAMTYMAQKQYDKAIDLLQEIQSGLDQVANPSMHAYLSQTVSEQLDEAKQNQRSVRETNLFGTA